MGAPRLLILGLIALALTSCAQLWGFDAGSLANDAAARIDPSSAADAARSDASDPTATQRGQNVSDDAEASRPPREGGIDARSSDAGHHSDHDAVTAALDAGHDSGGAHDSGVDRWLSPSKDASAHPPPACGATTCSNGQECATAVGGASVCVDATSTCTDGKECGPGGCCVWLDPGSPVGRCEAAADPANVQCLCVSDGKSGKEPGTCTGSCAKPANASGPVEVCDAPGGGGDPGGSGQG